VSEVISLVSREATLVSILISLVVWAVIAVLRGDLTTGKRLRDEQEEKEKWRQAYFTSEKANAELSKQNGILIENSRLLVPFIQAFGSGATKFLRAHEEEGGGS
jgi:hypothetical protein